MGVLVVDIGGTRVKLGLPALGTVRRFRSGCQLTPHLLMEELQQRTEDWRYDVVSIAFDGKVDPTTAASLQRVRAAGHRLLMVTGRELTDLFNTFDQIDLFDLGHSIVATVEPHEQTLIAAIHDLRIDWHVIFNKGSVMALPSDVTKATGLAKALEVVGVPWAATIGVGDAENDLPFLRRCGFAAAVRNALPSVLEIADLVTAEVRGAGVTELIGGWLNGALDAGGRKEEVGGSYRPRRIEANPPMRR